MKRAPKVRTGRGYKVRAILGTADVDGRERDVLVCGHIVPGYTRDAAPLARRCRVCTDTAPGTYSGRARVGDVHYKGSQVVALALDVFEGFYQGGRLWIPCGQQPPALGTAGAVRVTVSTTFDWTYTFSATPLET